MRQIVGKTSNAIFSIPNVMRGFGDGLSLPFTVTVTQLSLFALFVPLSFILVKLPPFLWIQPVFARVIVVFIAIPAAAAYLIGLKTPDDMNLFRYIRVRCLTFFEPTEVVRFEELDQSSFFFIADRITLNSQREAFDEDTK